MGSSGSKSDTTPEKQLPDSVGEESSESSALSTAKPSIKPEPSGEVESPASQARKLERLKEELPGSKTFLWQQVEEGLRVAGFLALSTTATFLVVHPLEQVQWYWSNRTSLQLFKVTSSQPESWFSCLRSFFGQSPTPTPTTAPTQQRSKQSNFGTKSSNPLKTGAGSPRSTMSTAPFRRLWSGFLLQGFCGVALIEAAFYGSYVWLTWFDRRGFGDRMIIQQQRECGDESSSSVADFGGPDSGLASSGLALIDTGASGFATAAMWAGVAGLITAICGSPLQYVCAWSKFSTRFNESSSHGLRARVTQGAQLQAQQLATQKQAMQGRRTKPGAISVDPPTIPEGLALRERFGGPRPPLSSKSGASKKNHGMRSYFDGSFLGYSNIVLYRFTLLVLYEIGRAYCLHVQWEATQQMFSEKRPSSGQRDQRDRTKLPLAEVSTLGLAAACTGTLLFRPLEVIHMKQLQIYYVHGCFGDYGTFQVSLKQAWHQVIQEEVKLGGANYAKAFWRGSLVVCVQRSVLAATLLPLMEHFRGGA